MKFSLKEILIGKRFFLQVNQEYQISVEFQFSLFLMALWFVKSVMLKEYLNASVTGGFHFTDSGLQFLVDGLGDQPGAV